MDEMDEKAFGLIERAVTAWENQNSLAASRNEIERRKAQALEDLAERARDYIEQKRAGII